MGAASDPDSPERRTSVVVGNQSVGGGKDIALLSGIILLINNITGPGVPSLPNLFVEAGWLPPTACILLMWLLTTLSASMFSEAMERIPGNSGFKGRVEFSTIVNHYFGRNWYIASQVSLNGALMSLNIISVIMSAEVMDVLIAALFSKSCGLNLTPFALHFGLNQTVVDGSTSFLSCIDSADLSNGNGWGCHVVLSLGYIVTAAMAIPCGAWNLDDNMLIQRGAFVTTAGCWVVWIVASLASGHTPSSPDAPTLRAINMDPQLGSVAGVLGGIFFNFGFVTTVPSWVNEKAPGVPINRTLWSATTFR